MQLYNTLGELFLGFYNNFYLRPLPLKS